MDGACVRDRGDLPCIHALFSFAEGQTVAVLAPRLAELGETAEDDIVPVETGLELYERLGRPERWVFNCGHEMLFLELGAFDTRIADWIDAHVPKASPSPAITAGNSASPLLTRNWPAGRTLACSPAALR